MQSLADNSKSPLPFLSSKQGSEKLLSPDPL